MRLQRTAWIPAILALGLGPGALQAAGEACLRNDTGQRLILHRAPSPGPRTSHCPDTLLAGIQGVAGTFHQLTTAFHPGPGATLTVEPGATVVLGWETAPAAGTRAHLGIRVGEEGRRGFLEFHAPQSGAAWGRLSAYLESGPRLQVTPVKALRPTFSLGGFQELPEPLDLDPLELAPELDPELPFGRIQALPHAAPVSRTRRLAPRLPLKNLTTEAHHLVYLSNQGNGNLVLTYPHQGGQASDPSLLAQVVLQHNDVNPEAWAPLLPGSSFPEPSGLRILPGQVAVLALDRKVVQAHQVVFSLAMEERKDLRLVHMSVPPQGPPTLGPLGLEDRMVMSADCDDTDTLIVDDRSFKH